MTAQGINVIFGTAGHTDPKLGFEDNDTILKSFEILEKHNIKKLDTAIIYGNGQVEAKLGEVTPKDRGFVFDTKWPGGFTGKQGASDADSILAMAKESIKKLAVDQVDIFYLHAPDRTTPLEDTLRGVNEAYKAGIFRRFGVSNFLPADVEQAHEICSKNGYVLPTVFQGIYSPINRTLETEMLPLLRKFGMSFYAYSPLAGGFLTKTKEQIEQGHGRFNAESIGGTYQNYFAKPAFTDVLVDWNEAAKMQGCSPSELAYRWVTYDSALKRDAGDTIIVGANGPKQLTQTLEGLEHGALDKAVVEKINAVWDRVQHASKLDMFH